MTKPERDLMGPIPALALPEWQPFVGRKCCILFTNGQRTEVAILQGADGVGARFAAKGLVSFVPWTAVQMIAMSGEAGQEEAGG